MNVLLIVVSLALLKLFSCAEVSKTIKTAMLTGSLESVPPDALHIIGSFLDTPFSTLGALNHSIRKKFSTFPIKSVINERLGFLKINLDEFNEDDKELRRLFVLSRFTRPNYIFDALRYEFFEGNKFQSLLPYLKNFLEQRCPSNIPKLIDDYTNLLKSRLIERMNLNYFFDSERPIFNEYASNFIKYHENIQRLQEYLLLNSDNLVSVQKYFEGVKFFSDDGKNIITWNSMVLTSNLPDEFLVMNPKVWEIFSQKINQLKEVLKSRALWLEYQVPIDLYDTVFDRINEIIRKCFTEAEGKHYYLLNLVRFGRPVPNLYDSEFKDKYFDDQFIDLITRCASLGNKMDLFDKLVNHPNSFLLQNCCAIYKNFAASPNSSNQKYKLLFDVHDLIASKYPGKLYNFYEKSAFYKILSQFGRVVSIHWDEGEIVVVFKTPAESIEFGFPEIVVTRQQFRNLLLFKGFVESIPSKMKFDNVESLGAFLFDYSSQYQRLSFNINGENLKLIVKSEDIIQSLRSKKIFFNVKLKEYLKVLDEPVPKLGDLLLHYFEKEEWTNLYDFKTTEQLERFEDIIGAKISVLFYHDIKNLDYFNARNIFRYLVKTGQQLPKDLPARTLTCLEAEFP